MEMRVFHFLSKLTLIIGFFNCRWQRLERSWLLLATALAEKLVFSSSSAKINFRTCTCQPSLRIMLPTSKLTANKCVFDTFEYLSIFAALTEQVRIFRLSWRFGTRQDKKIMVSTAQNAPRATFSFYRSPPAAQLSGYRRHSHVLLDRLAGQLRQHSGEVDARGERGSSLQQPKYVCF